MDAIFDLIGKVFNPILEMGGPVIMLIIDSIGFTFWSEILQSA
ncbi:Uncharacterised protein [Streptococcus pneumoniae]|nr:Uncharacterised protein [Streptococcus pneumoniae]